MNYLPVQKYEGSLRLWPLEVLPLTLAKTLLLAILPSYPLSISSSISSMALAASVPNKQILVMIPYMHLFFHI